MRTSSNSTLRAHQLAAADEVRAQRALLAVREKDYSLSDYIRHQVSNNGFRSASLDAVLELSENCRVRSGLDPSGVFVPLTALSRALTTSSDAAVSSAVATGAIVGNAVQEAMGESSVLSGGATILGGLRGNVDLLGLDDPGDVSGGFVAEVGVAPEVSPAFAGSTLSPMSLRFVLVVSKQMLFSLGSSFEESLRREMLRNAMRRIERGALIGAGGVEPTGILNSAGLNVLSAGANGLAPSWDHIIECEYDVANRNGESRAPLFAMSPKLRKKLRKTVRGTGLDFIMPASAKDLLGHPVVSSKFMPDNLDKGDSTGVCSALLYGDMSEVFIGFFGPMAVDVFVDPITLLSEGKVRLICSAYVGVGVRNIKAFTCYKDLLAS
jgi:HK97 family phage major capsid protein